MTSRTTDRDGSPARARGRRRPDRPDDRPRRSRALRLLRGLVRLTAAGLIAGALASLAAVLAGGGSPLPVVALAALAGWVAPMTLAATVLLAVARYRRSTVVALVLLVAVLVALRPWPQGNGTVPDSAVASGRAAQLTVLSQNVLFGQVAPEVILDAVRRERPDVLVLTELTRGQAAALATAGLREELPYTFLAPGYGAEGTGVWSRYPLGPGTTIPGMGFSSLDVSVRMPGGDVRVLAVHPTFPLADTWVPDFAALDRRVRAVRATGTPFLLAGDLNAADWNGPLRRLVDTGLVDASRARQWAWQGQTWPVDPGTAFVRRDSRLARVVLPLLRPVIRIDHLLVPAGAEVRDVRTVAMHGSDHLGVLATVRLPR